MLTYHDRRQRLEYIRNLMTHIKADSPGLRRLIFNFDNIDEPCFDNLPINGDIKNLSKDQRYALKHEIVLLLENEIKKLRRYKASSIKNSVGLCADFFKLTHTESNIFELILRINLDDNLDGIIQDYQRSAGIRKDQIYAVLLGVSHSKVRSVLSKSCLLKNGLIKKEFSSAGVAYKIPDLLLEALEKSSGSIDDIRTNILGEKIQPALDWTDFSYLGNKREVAKKLLSKSVEQKEKGINILLHGPPGTGKTELCKTLAAKAGLALYSVNDLDDRGGASNSRERLDDLRLKQRWMPKNEKAVILFDEMEDVGLGKTLYRNFSRGYDIGGKSFFNRLLEENPVPVLWTCNDAWWFDEAFMRRMSLVIELKAPPAKHMKTLLQKTANKSNIPLEERTINEIASYQSVSPGIFASSLRVTELVKGDDNTLKSNIQSVIKAMNGGRSIRPKDHNDAYAFRTDLSNTDINLQDLGKALHDCNSPGFSLCLYGPPGTGKSAYARSLAKEMELDVLFKRASDLLSMWVGGTEKNIAAAFEEAQETHAFLIIDEADSFLQDRGGAHRSWEITQVNEVLTWLENHPLPVAFTTNSFGTLDAASLRRFTFKIKFDYLNPDQALQAFRFFFDMDPPKDLQKLEILTPGDFANVRKKAQIMGSVQDRNKIHQMLSEECDLKPEHKNPIGFRV